MATRHLKRLQELQQAPQPASDPEEDSTEDEADKEPSTAPFNPFDLLSDEEVGRVAGRGWGMRAEPARHLQCMGRDLRRIVAVTGGMADGP